MAASRDQIAATRSQTFEEASVATLTAVTFLALAQNSRPGHGCEFPDGHPLPVVRTTGGGFRSAVPAGRRGLWPLDVREACRRAARELYPDHVDARRRWLPAEAPRPGERRLWGAVFPGSRLRKQ